MEKTGHKVALTLHVSLLSIQVNAQSPIILPREVTSEKQSYLFADFRNTPATGTVYNTTILITPPSEDNWFGEIYT